MHDGFIYSALLPFLHHLRPLALRPAAAAAAIRYLLYNKLYIALSVPVPGVTRTPHWPRYSPPKRRPWAMGFLWTAAMGSMCGVDAAQRYEVIKSAGI
jgi:hypothetical protein